MGNKGHKTVGSFEDWEKVETQDGIDIFRNKKNNELAQKRTITIDPHYDLEDEFEIYHARQHNHDSLVKAYGAQQVQKKGHSQGICSGHKKLQVLTEKISYRLSELPQLTFPQSLLFLRQSLRAYHKVFRSYGPIHITKKLIGINVFGEVRCWVNQNWAKNHPDHEFPTLQSTKLQTISTQAGSYGARSEVYNARYRDETQMVHNLVAVIEQRCEQGKFPQAFSEAVELNSSSFRKLSSYLQDLINVNGLFIPPKINYQTVFISKHQVQVTSQNQSQGQRQAVANQSQNLNQLSSSSQDQRIISTGGVNQNSNYISGGNQLGSGQSFGLSNTRYQGQQGVTNGTNGYTITKTTTTTYANGISGSSIHGSTSQPQILPSQGLNSASNAWVNNNNTSNLWQKSQSIYRPADNQSNYSSSYYQYSASNPSSVTVGNYKFGVTGAQLSLKNDSYNYKPSSYTTLSNGLAGNTTYNYPASNNQATFTSLENKFGGSDSDNPASPYQKFSVLNDKKTDFQITTGLTPIKQKQTYEEFKKNFGKVQPISGANSYSYTTTTYQTTNNKFDNLNSDSGQKGSIFSFDGRQQLGPKFGGYSGTNYQNTTGKYGTVSNNIGQNANNGLKIQGKYAQQFSNLLGSLPSWRNQQPETNKV